MSKIIQFKTKITSSDLLKQACDSLREMGIEVEGPEYKDSISMRDYDTGSSRTLNGHRVRLQGWTNDCVFECNEEGKMHADNYSPYGPQHPKVLSGEKRVGDDGKWGNIERLRELEVEYSVAASKKEATRLGYSLRERRNTETGVQLVYA